MVGHFSMPIDNANEGYGAIAVIERETSGNLKLISGEIITPENLAVKINSVANKTGNYLIAEFLKNSDEIKELCGDSVASFRVVMLVRNGEPEFFRALCLLPLFGHTTSNVKGFTTGSIACPISKEGYIKRAISSVGVNAIEIDIHPDTGIPLIEKKIIGWPALIEMVTQASRAMSPFRMQHWDIALTQRGPVIMEMNFIGSVAGCQIGGPPGLYSEQYLSFRQTHTLDNE